MGVCSLLMPNPFTAFREKYFFGERKFSLFPKYENENAPSTRFPLPTNEVNALSCFLLLTASCQFYIQN